MGLNTTHDPRQLSAGYAVEANNVLLSEGRIRPRAPFVPYCVLDGVEYVVPNNGYIAGMVQIPRGFEEAPAVLAQVYSPGSGFSLWRLDPDGVHEQLITAKGTSCFPWDYVQCGAWMVVLTGFGPSFKTRGDIGRTFDLSIEKPLSSQISQTIENLGTGSINASVRYAITWYRTADQTESNPLYFPSSPSQCLSPEGGEVVVFTLNELPEDRQGVDRIRIYRKNITLGQVAYRLIVEAGPLTEPMRLQDGHAESSIVISSMDTGPFAPCRNGVPFRPSIGAWYKNRLFVNCFMDTAVDAPTASKVFYSEERYPGHFYKDDYLDVSGDGTERVTGLLEHNGQLFIGKRRGIWVLSGAIQGPSRLTVALGRIPPVSGHTLRRVSAAVGPINICGNGFVVAGDSPTPYFASDSGFYAFDGIAMRLVSELIETTWKMFLDRSYHDPSRARITFAVDPQNGVLYLVNGYPFVYGVHPQILAYNTHTGGWTTLDGGELPGIGEQVLSIASALGDPTEENKLAYAPLLVAGTKGSLRICRSVEASDQPVAPWSWKTGRLTLVEGKQAHIYATEWFVSQSGPTPGGSPLIRVGFLLGAEEKEYSKRFDAGDRVQFDQRVGATATDITLTARSDDDWTDGWMPELGILGFSIDAEVAGKR